MQAQPCASMQQQAAAADAADLAAAARAPPRRLPTGQQLVHFGCLMGAGLLFLFFAVAIGLPTLLLSPSKFALFFSIGCCCVLSAFAALKGWRSQVAHMLARERLPFSAGARRACTGGRRRTEAQHGSACSAQQCFSKGAGHAMR